MIKKIPKPIALLTAGLLICTLSHGQIIHFDFTNGTSSTYTLADVRNVSYAADLMKLQLYDGSTYNWNLSTLGKIQFEETPVNSQTLLKAANALSVSLFPNPSENSLLVQFQLPKEDEIIIRMYDLEGKKILEKNLGKQVAGGYQVGLDLDNVQAGTYFCQLQGLSSTINKKFIKN